MFFVEETSTAMAIITEKTGDSIEAAVSLRRQSQSSDIKTSLQDIARSVTQ
jgi:hypothetical protein